MSSHPHVFFPAFLLTRIKLIVDAALSLKLLVYAALSLKLLVYAALSFSPACLVTRISCHPHFFRGRGGNGVRETKLLSQ